MTEKEINNQEYIQIENTSKNDFLELIKENFKNLKVKLIKIIGKMTNNDNLMLDKVKSVEIDEDKKKDNKGDVESSNLTEQEYKEALDIYQAILLVKTGSNDCLERNKNGQERRKEGNSIDFN